MDAVKLFHGKLSEDFLLKEKPFDALRTKLLRGAAGFCSKLEVLLAGQTDRPSRAALAQAYDELGDLTAKIGNRQEALAVRLKALAVRRELAAATGTSPAASGWREARLQVAQCLLAAGQLQEGTGDAVGALASYHEARKLAAAIEAPDRADAAVREVLGASHQGTSSILFSNGKLAESLAEEDRARAMRQALVDAHPAVTE
jgi:tetratricopeptide (TPR) repeat protein